MEYKHKFNDLASIELEARRMRAAAMADSVRRFRGAVRNAFSRTGHRAV